MFSIGEFSRVTGLTVKTLRFYHQQHLLTPSFVDRETGYRYYDAAKVEVARVIGALRALDFSLAEIAEILENYDDDADIGEFLERQRAMLEARIASHRQVTHTIDLILNQQREARVAMQESTFNVEEKSVAPIRVAGIRMRGNYSDCGQGFARLGRQFGRHINGKPMLLCYDQEYRENDADFEVCMPVRRGDSTDDIDVRELPGGHCVSLLHRGPYDTLGRSYEVLLAYVHEHGYVIEKPSREVYIKGPGMIFRGNSAKYLTEIQMLTCDANSPSARGDVARPDSA